MGEWMDTTLGAVVTFQSGGTPSKDIAAYWNGSVPWLSAKDMKQFRIDDTEDHVTELGIANGTKLVPAGTVLVLTRGMTLLNDIPMCLAKRPMAFNQDVKALRPQPELDGGFLPYLLLGNKERLLGMVDLAGHGTGRLNTDEVKALDIALPPASQQRAIAHIFSALDDKIDLNRRMSETLEATARALFKSWFIDFDPVRAKIDRRDTGLSNHISNLFPKSLVESEIGKVPQGWRIGRLGDVLVQRVERCAPSVETADRPYVPIDCISPKSLFLMTSKPGSEAQSSLTRFYESDLLFGAMRPYFHKVCIAPFDGTTRTTVFVLFPSRKEDYSFAALLLHEPDTIDFATRHSTGSTIPYAVWPDSLERMPVLLPPVELRNAFDILIRPILQRIPARYFEAQTLTALRDTLLPKLISGQLRIKEAERFVGAAV